MIARPQRWISCALALVASLWVALGVAQAEPRGYVFEVDGLGSMVLYGETAPDAVKHYVDGVIRRGAFPGGTAALRAWGVTLAQQAEHAPTLASLRSDEHPIIGIQLGNQTDLTGTAAEKASRLKYAEAVRRAGGTPVFLAPAGSVRLIEPLLGSLDHLVLAGGADIHPSLYGEQVTHAQNLNLVRDKYERRLVRTALRGQIGVEGICRGCQMLTVAAGGTLTQDLHLDGVTTAPHMTNEQTPLAHPVVLTEESATARVIGSVRIRAVQSIHHQAIKQAPKGWKITGRAPDGVPEAMEIEGGRHRCYQFHPERSGKAAFSRAIFKDMVGRARNFAQTRAGK